MARIARYKTDTIRTTVTLPAHMIDYAIKVGEGNLSSGLREIVRQYLERKYIDNLQEARKRGDKTFELSREDAYFNARHRAGMVPELNPYEHILASEITQDDSEAEAARKYLLHIATIFAPVEYLIDLATDRKAALLEHGPDNL